MLGCQLHCNDSYNERGDDAAFIYCANAGKSVCMVDKMRSYFTANEWIKALLSFLGFGTGLAIMFFAGAVVIASIPVVISVNVHIRSWQWPALGQDFQVLFLLLGMPGVIAIVGGAILFIAGAYLTDRQYRKLERWAETWKRRRRR